MERRMAVIEPFFLTLGIELSRALTGRLFNDDQIRAVTKSAVGRYFTDFLPAPTGETTAKERVAEARDHIGKASSIITQMQQELSVQATQLEQLLTEIEEKKELAERYSNLAATNQQQLSAFRGEIEELLRRELAAQAEKGRRLRQAASFAIWLVTLVLGAWLGTYFKEVVAWAKALMAAT
jgi:hypothetical protein